MSKFKRILAFLSSCSGLFLGLAACANFYLAYRASTVVNTVVHTNVVEMVVVNSNDVFSVSASTNSLPSLVVPPSVSPSRPLPREPRQIAEYPYQYFLCGRRIGAHMFGRYYYDGSPCSFGRIDKIYPDRIILVGGDWIQNRFESTVVSRKPSTHGVKSHD